MACSCYERGEAAVWANMAARGRGFERGSLARQRAIAHASWRYGEWLRQQAQTLGLPVIAPRPWETLAERIVGAIG